jgi:ATP-dependent DNA helicase RecG
MDLKENLLDSIISGIETTILHGEFQDFESTIVELKDLSTGSEWTSLKQTICAYLNTNGGYVLCGIRERDHKYSFPGFDRNNEGRLIELRTKFFKNDLDVFPDLSENLEFDYRVVHGKTLAIITVSPLSEDLKYLNYDGISYERVLTQDKVIPKAKIIQHQEYKSELEYSKEISVVPNASLKDLDIDKINQFIIKINATGKKETVKKDIQDALDFLSRRYCINKEHALTVIGLLLFGSEPSQYLENRSRLDCYFETGHEIGRDKKYLDSDILNLMDDAFSFVWGHIKVGRSVVGGGRSEPEFPIELIRETVNNALAHRDYTINKFITIKVNPGESIEIKNPGKFKQKMLLNDQTDGYEVRRIVPGVAESKNPKLANILKAYDKIESQGRGMATLVEKCLENKIDVPYYDLSIPDTISLIMPSGELMDDKIKRWLNSFYGFLSNKLNGKITKEHELVLAYFLKSEWLNQKRYYTILLSPSNNHFDVLTDLKRAGLILEHPKASTEQTPLYVLNKELMVSDFTRYIEEQTGMSLEYVDDLYKRVLNIVFRYNHYNYQSIKPNIITPELYMQLHGKVIDPTTYESLGRKVRKICSDLVKAEYLIKKEDKSYEVKRK